MEDSNRSIFGLNTSMYVFVVGPQSKQIFDCIAIAKLDDFSEGSIVQIEEEFFMIKKVTPVINFDKLCTTYITKVEKLDAEYEDSISHLLHI